MPINIPVHVYLISLLDNTRQIANSGGFQNERGTVTQSSSAVNCAWNQNLAIEVVRRASQVWVRNGSGISFSLSPPITNLTITLPSRFPPNFLSPQATLWVRDELRPPAHIIPLFLTNRTGRSLLGGEAVYTDSDPQRICVLGLTNEMSLLGDVLAHEFGHVLGLHHYSFSDYPAIDENNARQVAERVNTYNNNLMLPDRMVGTGTRLTNTQKETARNSDLARRHTTLDQRRVH